MNKNGEPQANPNTQPPEENGPPLAEGESGTPPVRKSRSRGNKRVSQSPAPNPVSTSSLDVTLGGMTLIERDKQYHLNELDLYEIRERNMKTINEYVIRRKTSAPPNIIVVQIEGRKPVVVDGVTRYIAAVIDGAATITADVYQGTWEQVKILALKLNQHGEKLSSDDIKRQIDRLDEEHKDNLLSTREMAKLLGTSHTTVAAHRAMRGQSVLEGIQSLRRGKTPDEKRAAMVKNVLRMVEEQGDEVLDDMIAALPLALRVALLDRLAATYSRGS